LHTRPYGETERLVESYRGAIRHLTAHPALAERCNAENGDLRRRQDLPLEPARHHTTDRAAQPQTGDRDHSRSVAG